MLDWPIDLACMVLHNETSFGGATRLEVYRYGAVTLSLAQPGSQIPPRIALYHWLILEGEIEQQLDVGCTQVCLHDWCSFRCHIYNTQYALPSIASLTTLSSPQLIHLCNTLLKLLVLALLVAMSLCLQSQH
jgi:hypothetical protein